MMPNMKYKATTYAFLLILSLFFMANLVLPDQLLSYAERRPLQSFDTLDYSQLTKGGFGESFDAVALDQFFLRDSFRSLKAYLAFGIFRKHDNNQIAVIGDHIFKSEHPYDPQAVEGFSQYMESFSLRFLQNSRVLISIIPDKSHYLIGKDLLLTLDYPLIAQAVYRSLPQMTAIDLSTALTLDDFYQTDAHWKQENLGGVLKALEEPLGFKMDFKMTDYTPQTFAPFYGGYYGQSALPVKPDTLTYLTHGSLDQIIVTHYGKEQDTQQTTDIYDIEKLGKMDSYDVFLSGPSPIVILKNPSLKTGKELIIVRDSFASSLAPLLSQVYDQITLVDLRYIHQDLLADYVDFENKDVLILLSTNLVMKSQVLK